MHIKMLSSVTELLIALGQTSPSEHTLFVNATHATPESLLAGIRGATALAADFDGTLTPGGQWLVLKTWLSAADRVLDAEATTAYFAQTKRPNVENLVYLFESIERFYGIQLGGFNNFARSLPPREGAVDFIRSFEPDKVGVISFGLANFIRTWLKYHVPGNRAHVFALELLFKEGLIGYKPETAVTDSNKGHMRDVFVAHTKTPQNRVLVIGDAPTDLAMMHPENVGILLIPKIDPDPQRMKHRLNGLEALWPLVQGVLVSDSLAPLASLRTTSR